MIASGLTSLSTSQLQKRVRALAAGDLLTLRHNAKYTEWAFREEARQAMATSFRNSPRLMTTLQVSKRIDELPSIAPYLRSVNGIVSFVSHPLVLLGVVGASSAWFGPFTVANLVTSGVSVVLAWESAEACRSINTVLRAERAHHWANQWCEVYENADRLRAELLKEYLQENLRDDMEDRFQTVAQQRLTLKKSSPETDPEAKNIAFQDLNATWEQQDIARTDIDFGIAPAAKS